jgi:hypothetical protein
MSRQFRSFKKLLWCQDSKRCFCFLNFLQTVTGDDLFAPLLFRTENLAKNVEKKTERREKKVSFQT